MFNKKHKAVLLIEAIPRMKNFWSSSSASAVWAANPRNSNKTKHKSFKMWNSIPIFNPLPKAKSLKFLKKSDN